MSNFFSNISIGLKNPISVKAYLQCTGLTYFIAYFLKSDRQCADFRQRLRLVLYITKLRDSIMVMVWIFASSLLLIRKQTEQRKSFINCGSRSPVATTARTGHTSS